MRAKIFERFFTLIKSIQPLKSTPNRSKIAKKMISANHTKKILITLNSQTHPPPPGGYGLSAYTLGPKNFSVISPMIEPYCNTTTTLPQQKGIEPYTKCRTQGV